MSRTRNHLHLVGENPEFAAHLDKIEAVIKPFKVLLKSRDIRLVIKTLADGTVEIYGEYCNAPKA